MIVSNMNRRRKMKKEIEKYMRDNKEGMAKSHLEGWFSEYVGMDKEDARWKLESEHDNCVLIEELKNEFSNITEEELEKCIKLFIEEVLNTLNFGGQH